jgi:hypothetical protein
MEKIELVEAINEPLMITAETITAASNGDEVSAEQRTRNCFREIVRASIRILHGELEVNKDIDLTLFIDTLCDFYQLVGSLNPIPETVKKQVLKVRRDIVKILAKIDEKHLCNDDVRLLRVCDNLYRKLLNRLYFPVFFYQ